MDSNVKRRSVAPVAWVAAILATLAGVANDFCSESPAARPPAPHCDLPLGRIDCDVVPLTPALPADVLEDQRSRPYHCLVRVFSFPKIAPLEVEPESVRVLGAEASRRIAPGEYLFENLANAQTVVSVTRRIASEPPAAGAPPGPPASVTDRRESIATRAPLMLSRHAVTVCDLYVAADQDLSGTVAFKGVVLARENGRPIEGATVQCKSAGVRTMSLADGTFEFPEPLPWSALLAGTTVEKPGYAGVGLRERALLSLWVERFVKDGMAAFALSIDRRTESRRTTIPPLPN